MKKTIMVLLVSCTSLLLAAQKDAGETPFLVKSLAGQPVKDVEVETSGGNISVQGDASDSRIEVFIWASNGKRGSNLSKEDIQSRLDEYYDLKIDVKNSTLTATAKPKTKMKDWKKGLSISFKVFVSRDVSTDLTTSGGNIDLRGLSGEQRITTSGGNLHIDDIKGKLKGSTSGGNIHVKNSNENIDLTTSGGNIEAENCTGGIKLGTSGGSLRLMKLDGNINASTSGGNVNADDIKGDLVANTSGGNINLAGLACNVSTGTSGGDIRVTVKEPGKFVRIRNSGGRIELQLPAGKGYDLDLTGDNVQADNLGNFQGKREHDQIDGKVNGGGTEVNVNASSGKLVLTLK
jgi:DUF4097 and DUF4098 domain-containing protein YvlB